MSNAEFLELLSKLGPTDRQEILDRLCDPQEAEFGHLHQQWVDEALNSGPPHPATAADWQGALQRGLARTAKRS
jgi:hypothetical protein